MKLVVLGANGRTGQHVVTNALEQGLLVTAVVRSADKAPAIAHDRLRVVVGDPCDPAVLRRAFAGRDAVISALGGRSPTKAATSVYDRSAEAMVEAAWDTGLKRVLVTSTALLFPEQALMGRLLRGLVPNVARSAGRMEEILMASGLTWTSARAGFLTDAADPTYQAQKDQPSRTGTSVSRRALAAFLVDALDDETTFGASFSVANRSAEMAQTQVAANDRLRA